MKKYKSVSIHFYISSRATLKETFIATMLWLHFAQNTLSETKIRNLHP